VYILPYLAAHEIYSYRTYKATHCNNSLKPTIMSSIPVNITLSGVPNTGDLLVDGVDVRLKEIILSIASEVMVEVVELEWRWWNWR
jgi:hypothetical protein